MYNDLSFIRLLIENVEYYEPERDNRDYLPKRPLPERYDRRYYRSRKLRNYRNNKRYPDDPPPYYIYRNAPILGRLPRTYVNNDPNDKPSDDDSDSRGNPRRDKSRREESRKGSRRRGSYSKDSRRSDSYYRGSYSKDSRYSNSRRRDSSYRDGRRRRYDDSEDDFVRNRYSY